MKFSDFIRSDNNKEAVMMDVMDKARREQLRTLAQSDKESGHFTSSIDPTDLLALLDMVDELESAAAAVQSAEPGVTVKFDLSPAMVESAIRDRLAELGWTPPNPPPSASDLEARQAKAVALEGRDSLLTGSRNTTAVCHPPSAVPEGWKLVPVEPTPEMLSGLVGPAGYCSMPLADAYKAMLAAAPQGGGE